MKTPAYAVTALLVASILASLGAILAARTGHLYLFQGGLALAYLLTLGAWGADRAALLATPPREVVREVVRTVTPQAVTLAAQRRVSRFALLGGPGPGARDMAAEVIRHEQALMAEQLALSVQPYMAVRTSEDPATGDLVLTGTLRVYEAT